MNCSKILCIFLWEFPACRTSSLQFIVKVKCLDTNLKTMLVHSALPAWLVWYQHQSLSKSAVLWTDPQLFASCDISVPVLFLGVNSRERHGAPYDVCALKCTFAILPKMLFHSCSSTALPDAHGNSCGRKETSEWLFDSSALVLFLGSSNLPFLWNKGSGGSVSFSAPFSLGLKSVLIWHFMSKVKYFLAYKGVEFRH